MFLNIHFNFFYYVNFKLLYFMKGISAPAHNCSALFKIASARLFLLPKSKGKPSAAGFIFLWPRHRRQGDPLEDYLSSLNLVCSPQPPLYHRRLRHRRPFTRASVFSCILIIDKKKKTFLFKHMSSVFPR